MSKCKQCGFELDADVRFCPNCATKVDTTPPPAVPTGGGFTETISGTATVFAPEQADSSLDLEAGKEFHGRYRIERKLGQGAMGVVYLATDKLTSRSVALKLINPALVNSASARERFIREGLIARDIRHKSVVAVYDVSEAEGQYYIVMEFLTGETLRSWLHRFLQAGNDIPYDLAEKIIRNILEGLDAAHVAGVVHRDIKPENVMLTGSPEGGDFSLKILDFGIARAVDSAAVITTSTSTGTALYMAPEQKTAADTVGPPADLYAVTAIFYELLLGVAPGGRWVPLSKEREDLPPGIDVVIEKGLSSRPRSRYQNAQEYFRALHEIRMAPTPTPIPVPEPFVPFVDPVLPLPPHKSSVKKWVWIGIAVLFGIWLIGVLIKIGPNGGKKEGTTIVNPPLDDERPVSPPPVVPPSNPKFTVPVDANYAGTWIDELEGTGIARSRVVLTQSGKMIAGSIFDMNGFLLGTVTGVVNGTVLDYRYFSNFGNGYGRGVMASDGDVDVLVNGFEKHVMHRNHMPG
jgi:serine/threonine protein kinase